MKLKKRLKAKFEQMIIDAEKTKLSPLTREDLQSVRRLIRRPHLS
jgi:hypothetical protein